MRLKWIVVAVTTSLTAAISLSLVQAQANEPIQLEISAVPGFGLYEEDILRDESIAVYEAWQRNELVNDCMAVQEMRADSQVLYPEESLADVADYLEVTPTGDADPPVGELDKMADEPSVVQDEWSNALYGEDYADLVAAQEGSAQISADFATEGCIGEAEDAVPGVWEFRDSLWDEWEGYRVQSRTTPQFVAAQTSFADCIEDELGTRHETPGAVEELLDGVTSSTQVGTVSTALHLCDPLWQQATLAGLSAVEQQFIDAHEAEIDQIASDYATLMTALRDDPEFESFLEANAP